MAAEWLLFASGLLTFAIVQWTLLAILPLSLTYYDNGLAKRRRISLGRLIHHAMAGNVELHGPLLYVDTGKEKGNIGGNWASLALATLVVGPWVLQTKIY